MTTVRDFKPRPTVPPRRPEPPAVAERRPFRDNPRLILAGIVLLLVSLIAMITLADRSTKFNPDFLSEVVLYALSIADVTMLIALAFVLARNVVKLVVERRRGLPFSRFRLKLVAALLGLTIVPSVLVLLVGSELIRKTTERWFSIPVSEVLTSSNAIASTYYRDREAAVASQASRIATRVSVQAIATGDLAALKPAVSGPVTDGRVGMVEVYRIRPGEAGARPEVVPIFALESPALPRGHVRASADLLAARVAAGSSDTQAHEPLNAGGELVRAGAIARDANGTPVGVVIASDFLPGDLARHARRIAEAYEDYSQLRVLKRPLEGVYLSLFLMMTLLILVSATWLGLYLAKRITRPVHMLAAGAREIGAGHLDHRIEPETRDEFGSLVEAFNAMAGELATSQKRLDRSRRDLERKNSELDERRRYIETILERIATGVISIGPDGRVSTINGAALRLLGVDAAIVGADADQVFGREDLQPVAALIRSVNTSSKPAGQEIALARGGREVHLAAAATALQGGGAHEGTVLVFDDVTPLVRTQRVAAWRDVARRLAHEIKNPLTPIQLCAERMRRHFGTAPPPVKELVDECTSTIVGEVESLKALVDEFAQFARMPAPRAVPSNLNAVLNETLALYNGLFVRIQLERQFAIALPPVRLDVEQIRRVVINLVDNAIEALGGTQGAAPLDGRTPVITIETQHDSGNAVVRLVVVDNGPGVPEEDRDKLFMPYYSTKRRGSGLGLAIVRRIVAEHGGSIEVGENIPHGSRFVIELPC